MRNTETRHQSMTSAIERGLKWSWAGHLARPGDSRWSKVVESGSKKPGPSKSWLSWYRKNGGKHLDETPRIEESGRRKERPHTQQWEIPGWDDDDYILHCNTYTYYNGYICIIKKFEVVRIIIWCRLGINITCEAHLWKCIKRQRCNKRNFLTILLQG